MVADTSVSLSVTWKKDNEDLGSGASGQRITVDTDNAQSSIFQGTGKYTTTLVIRMVSSEDEGQFLFTENGAVIKQRKTLNGAGFLSYLPVPMYVGQFLLLLVDNLDIC